MKRLSVVNRVGQLPVIASWHRPLEAHCLIVFPSPLELWIWACCGVDLVARVEVDSQSCIVLYYYQTESSRVERTSHDKHRLLVSPLQNSGAIKALRFCAESLLLSPRQQIA